MSVHRIDRTNREQVNKFITERWLSTEMVIRAEVIDMTKVEGYLVYEGDRLTALITYVVREDTCEITSLDSLEQGKGTASMLLEQVAGEARDRGCRRLRVVTTNDNLGAMRFYSRRGFRLVEVRRDALVRSRVLKPGIPLTGQRGIPLRHEIEYEKIL